MQKTNNNMIIIKQQQHIEHLATTKTQIEKEKKRNIPKSWWPLQQWATYNPASHMGKRPLKIKPKHRLLIPNSKPCLLKP